MLSLGLMSSTGQKKDKPLTRHMHMASHITTCMVHCQAGKTTVDCHRIAHQTASKKISRLINEGGYKLCSHKMRESVRFIHKMGSVPDDEVRQMMQDLGDDALRSQDEEKHKRSREIFQVLVRYSKTPASGRANFNPRCGGFTFEGFQE